MQQEQYWQKQKQENLNNEKENMDLFKPKDNLISVIVPVFNIEKYIKKCIDSVLSQTYKNIEIIIVDDGSTDNTGTIIDAYDDKKIRVIHQNNEGVVSARLNGIKVANGE